MSGIFLFSSSFSSRSSLLVLCKNNISGAASLFLCHGNLVPGTKNAGGAPTLSGRIKIQNMKRTTTDDQVTSYLIKLPKDMDGYVTKPMKSLTSMWIR